MRLEQATDGLVLRNSRNGHFYRYVKKEGRRVRIRPLELFPNGLLQEKTTDTIVEADLEVDAVGDWKDDFWVEVKSSKTRTTYERELSKEQERLTVLEAEALVIDPKERGSHANRVKAVRSRVKVLVRGLALRPEDCSVETARKGKSAKRDHDKRDLVTLPSGKPARVIQFVNGTKTRVMVNTEGRRALILVPTAILTKHRLGRQASTA